jgi:hypothetical protein
VPTPAPTAAAKRAGAGAGTAGVVDRDRWPIASWLGGNGCIVVRGAANEAQVVKSACSLTFLDQYWTFRAADAGYWYLVNANSNKCLLVRGTAYDTPAVQFDCGAYQDEQWQVIEDTTGRWFMLKNRWSGMCLAMRGSETNARQVTCDQQYGDQWWRRGMPDGPARTNGLSKPTYFVHGYSDNGSGFNANGAYWDDIIGSFNRGDPEHQDPMRFFGPIGRSWTYCYYSTDTGCDLLSLGDRNRSVKDVGADLAWEIYDHYSKYNVAVDVVGHSMGGLVARAALTGVSRGDPAFPPYLYVEDVVTLSSPHRGAPSASLCLFQQCVDMRAGSAFHNWLFDAPQGASGTDWTVIGFDDDLTMPVWSSVPDNMTAVSHKHISAEGQFLPKPTAHMDLLARAASNDEVFRVYSCSYGRSCTMSDRSTFPLGYQFNPGYLTRLAAYWQADS